MANEKRLVDVNEPINAFKRYAKNHPNATWNAFGIEAVLNAAKVVDAVEVVHGHWDLFFDGKELQCSVCKATFFDEEQSGGTNYCPNCGAKMDGGDEDG